MKILFKECAYLAMVLACAAGTVANAQESMTLRDCMEYAISNSTKMRIQQAAIGDAQIDRRDAVLTLFTPQISAQTYAYYNFGRSIDPQTNTYFNTTSFHNNYGISAGQTYYLNLQLGQSEEAVIIPRGTFYQKTGGKWIYVVNKEGNKAVKREIRIGRQNPQYYEVLEGLAPGEKVITSGYDTYGDSDVLVF